MIPSQENSARPCWGREDRGGRRGEEGEGEGEEKSTGIAKAGREEGDLKEGRRVLGHRNWS